MDPDQPIRRVGVGGRTEEFPPNDLTPAEVERRLAAEPVEWLYVYDPTDNQIARFRGTSDEVDLSDELKARTGVHGLYGEPVLKDHLIVHNHPPKSGPEPITSFPPSSTDLAMAVICDLRALVIVSGGVRYEIQRPGPVWPFDEDLLVSALDQINRDLDKEDRSPTRRGSIERQELILHRLNSLGVMNYEKVARPRGV